MTLEEAKAYLRIETAHEDALIVSLVAGAIDVAEAYLGLVLVQRPIEEIVAANGEWRALSLTPVAAITQVTTPDGTALAAAAHEIDIDARGGGWVRADGPGRVRVRYLAGSAETAAGVPAAIAQGVIRLAAHLYTHRDDGAAPPAAVTALWRPYRRLRLGLEARA